jgi:hypothetical protein
VIALQKKQLKGIAISQRFIDFALKDPTKGNRSLEKTSALLGISRVPGTKNDTYHNK